MQIDVQKFMELRDSARLKEGLPVKSKSEQTDWRSLLDSKRKEIGLEPEAQSASKKEIKSTKIVAEDFDGTMEERVSALRERSAEGLPVRELGNFIDVRA